jgi:hypothetical protein
MSAVEPSEYVPVAVNWSVAPTARPPGDSGVIAIEDSVGVGAATFRVTAGLVTPDREAVISAVPAATPVAKPASETVAILVSELAQVTREVMSAVEPSE